MMPNKSALDFFELVFTVDLYDLIVRETNRYATQQREDPRNQKQPWSDLTVDELKTWLGLYLAMGIIQQPSLVDYWLCGTLTKTLGTAAVMTKNRFSLFFFFKFCITYSTVKKQ